MIYRVYYIYIYKYIHIDLMWSKEVGEVIFWCCLWCCSGSEFLHIIKWCTKRIIPTDTEVFLLKNGTNQPYLDILLEQLFRDICFCKLPWIERLGCHGYVDGILVFSTCLDVGNYWTIWTPNNNPILGVSTPKKAQGGAIFADVWWFCFFFKVGPQFLRHTHSSHDTRGW